MAGRDSFAGVAGGAETQAAIDLYDHVILERKRGLSGKAEVDDDLPYLDPFNPFLKGDKR